MPGGLPQCEGHQAHNHCQEDPSEMVELWAPLWVLACTSTPDTGRLGRREHQDQASPAETERRRERVVVPGQADVISTGCLGEEEKDLERELPNRKLRPDTKGS